MKSKNGYQLKPSVDISNLPKVEGYDFESKFDIDRFLKSYYSTGFQAKELGKAIEIVNIMIREKVPIFLSCTSNIISSGLREAVKYMVKHKHINVLVTSAGGIEEDIIKTISPFRIGSFDAKGSLLADAGVSRIGNIYVTNEHYLHFERFINRFLERIYKLQKKDKPLSSSQIIFELGREISKLKNREESVLYWAYRNRIDVYCPCITDGSFGDLVYFFRKIKPDFMIDIVGDIAKIVDFTMNCSKTAAIILGGGIAKHYVLNANIFKDGLDYAVYISTADFYDGSDSGGSEEEAISWNKISHNAPHVKVYAEATLVFPLLVAATFAKK